MRETAIRSVRLARPRHLAAVCAEPPVSIVKRAEPGMPISNLSSIR